MFYLCFTVQTLPELLHAKQESVLKKKLLLYKLYRLFLSPHSLSVTIVTLGFRLFFILVINLLLFGHNFTVGVRARRDHKGRPNNEAVSRRHGLDGNDVRSRP